MTEQRLVDTYTDTETNVLAQRNYVRLFRISVCDCEARLTCGGGDSGVLRGHGCSGGAGRGNAHRVD